MSGVIRRVDLVDSIAGALQFISVYHPPDFIAHLAQAHEREKSPAARNAMAQILVNSRMAALGRRPICQDTGTVNVFLKVGLQARFDFDEPMAGVVDEAVARAYTDPDNPLRASILADPLFDRRNTGTNAPAVTHVELTAGSAVTVHVAAKGGGSENKACFAALNPGDSVADWVVRTVEGLGAGWCPPGILGIGVGGTAEKAMLLAKEALLQPLDFGALQERGPITPLEELRVELYERINALGIGAQGLGGLATVLDVKIATYPVHAASLPVALIPQCVADRHIGFRLDGSGPAAFDAPALDIWPRIALDADGDARRINLDTLTREDVATWRAGQTLLLSGHLLTGRDAAHRRLAGMLAKGEALPVTLRDRAIYYVGPVDAMPGEAVGPAGPTTATRMDPYTDMLLERTGLLVMIGKAERGDDTIASIGRHGAAYLIAVGGAAYLVSKAVRAARVVAFADLGMEAIHEFTVEDMPVTVAVDALGHAIHKEGPRRWRAPDIRYKGAGRTNGPAA